MRTGTADISEKYLSAIRSTAEEYAQGIFRILREHEYDPELMRLFVVGGGGCIIKNFTDYDKNRVIINDDICATAKGYVSALEKKLDVILKQEQKYSEEIEKAVAEYKEMKESATDFDPAELREEQLKLRYDKEVQSSQIIRSNGKELVTSRFNYSIRDVNYFLGEKNDSRSILQKLSQHKPTPNRKKNIKHGREER